MRKDSLVLEMLKWAGIVLAAGFIGYFGRYLSMILIDRLRHKRWPCPPFAAEGRDERRECRRQ